MREISCVLFMATLALALGAHHAHASPAERSISASRQFIVYAPEAQLRGALCDLAERTKRHLLALLGQNDNWNTPLVVYAQYPQANLPETPAAALNFSQTGFGLKLQLDLTIAADVNASAVERELLRGVVLEMIYRAAPETPAGTLYVSPPDWLLDGILSRANLDESNALAEVLAAGKETIPLEAFLRQRPQLLDSQSRALYRACSFALVTLLLESPEGRAHLARFIGDLARASHDPLIDLQTHFPMLAGGKEKAEKIWTSTIARLAFRHSHGLLGPAETGRQLDDLLRVKLAQNAGAPKAFDLMEFPTFVRLPASGPALQRLGQGLLLLSARAHSLYRPILEEYHAIAVRLARRKTRGIPQRLVRLHAARARIASQTRAMDDFMNWFEATQSRTPSGAFASYLKAAEAALQPPPRRRDPISVYLDALESQFPN